MKKKLPNTQPQTLKEAYAEWTPKLVASGFVDIEDVNHPERPLKEWHSRKFCTERSIERQADREKYDKQISDFLNSDPINEICSLIVSHGNSSIGPKKVKKILELHSIEGFSERKIAKEVKCGKKCVHTTLKKAKEWMKVA